MKAEGSGDDYKHTLKWVNQDEHIYDTIKTLVDNAADFPFDMLVKDWNELMWMRRPTRGTNEQHYVPCYETTGGGIKRFQMKGEPI